MSITIFKQDGTTQIMPQQARILDAAARLVPSMPVNTEFQGAKLTFDYRVIEGKLQIQNLLLEITPPTKLVIQ